jgi:hypothetical protein
MPAPCVNVAMGMVPVTVNDLPAATVASSTVAQASGFCHVGLLTLGAFEDRWRYRTSTHLPASQGQRVRQTPNEDEHEP